MFILKIKSKPNVPDYVQIRDNDFTLLAYCSINNLDNALEHLGDNAMKNRIVEAALDANYWQIIKIDFND